MSHPHPGPTGYPAYPPPWETGYGSDVALQPIVPKGGPYVYQVVAQNPNGIEPPLPPPTSIDSTRPWKPGFFSSFPFLGVCAALLSLGCTGAAVGLLRYCDQQQTSEWPYRLQPSVLLAGTSTLANALLGTAFSSGATIYLWRHAFKGHKIMDFHYNWAGGQGPVQALGSLWRLKAVHISLACILVFLTTIVRGPLFQQALSIDTEIHQVDGTISFPIAREINSTWAGRITGNTAQVIYGVEFSSVVTNYQNREAMTISSSSPPCDNCTLSVEGFGFYANCSTTSRPYNMSQHKDPRSDLYTEPIDLFSVNMSVPVTPRTDAADITITVVRRLSNDCIGALEVEVCLVRPATLRYDVELDNGVVSLANGSWKDDTTLSTLSLLSPWAGGSTLGVLLHYAETVFESSFDTTWHSLFGWLYVTTGTLGNMYLAEIPSAECGPFFREDSPMDEILNTLREIGFRIALKAAAVVEGDDSARQSVPYSSRLFRIIYVVDYTSLAIAVAISVFAVLVTMTIFWGWPGLGRTVSMSPLEFGAAFSPNTGTLAGFGSNCTPGDMEKVYKQKDQPVVRYGVHKHTGYLGMFEQTQTTRPRRGQRL